MPTQHMEVKIQNNDNNNNKAPNAEKVYYTKKQNFFKNWSYVCAIFGILTFMLNFLVFAMIPSVNGSHNVWMGFHKFSLVDFDPNNINMSISGAGACCIAFNIIWTIMLIVELIGNRLNGVKLYAPYVRNYSIILLVASYFIMILGITATPMHSESSCMFSYDAATFTYSYTSIGIVILVEFIAFVVILIGKIIWYHVSKEKKEWFLNTRIVKRIHPKKSSKKE